MKKILLALMIMFISIINGLAQLVIDPSKTGKQFTYYIEETIYTEESVFENGMASTKTGIDTNHILLKFVRGNIRLTAASQPKFNAIAQQLKEYKISLQVKDSKTLFVTFPYKASIQSNIVYSQLNFPYEKFNNLFFQQFKIQPVHISNLKHGNWQGIWEYDKPVKNLKIANGQIIEADTETGPITRVGGDRHPGSIIGWLEIMGDKKDQLSILIALNDIKKTVVINLKSEIVACYYQNDNLDKIYPETNYQHGLEFVNRYKPDLIDAKPIFRKFFTKKNLDNIISCR